MDDEAPVSSHAKWTVLTYIAAHNNLDQLGKKSLLEILDVGSTPEVVQGVLYDGALPRRTQEQQRAI